MIAQKRGGGGVWHPAGIPMHLPHRQFCTPAYIFLREVSDARACHPGRTCVGMQTPFHFRFLKPCFLENSMSVNRGGSDA